MSAFQASWFSVRSIDVVRGRVGQKPSRDFGHRENVPPGIPMMTPQQVPLAAGQSICRLTACPPNCCLSAASMRPAIGFSWRDRNRYCNAAVITGAGTASSIEASTVHRPSPESSTYELRDDKSGSSARADALKSSSHDFITLPYLQFF